MLSRIFAATPLFRNSPACRWAGAGLVLFAIAASILVPCRAEEELPGRERFDLFLLVGQSNMAGRGNVTDEDREVPRGVLTLDQAGRWVAARDPLHFDKPSVVGVGLGRTFGIEIARAAPERTIGLIPSAVGGSPIDAWKPGVFYEPTASHPWDDAIRRARLAMRDGTLRGILWHQGESDSTAELSVEYEAKLHDLVRRFRAELEVPDCPFVVGQLGQFPERPWDDFKRTVDRAHQRLPSVLARTACVSSDGLVHNGDFVHFDSASYREFGRRYATAYRLLVKP
jgi:pimeloyl-ACP methyl ester carboxylesterase